MDEACNVNINESALTISLSSPNLKLSCTTLSSYLHTHEHHEYRPKSAQYPLLDLVLVELALLDLGEVPCDDVFGRRSDDGVLLLIVTHVEPMTSHETTPGAGSSSTKYTLRE